MLWGTDVPWGCARYATKWYTLYSLLLCVTSFTEDPCKCLPEGDGSGVMHRLLVTLQVVLSIAFVVATRVGTSESLLSIFSQNKIGWWLVEIVRQFLRMDRHFGHSAVRRWRHFKRRRIVATTTQFGIFFIIPRTLFFIWLEIFILLTWELCDGRSVIGFVISLILIWLKSLTFGCGRCCCAFFLEINRIWIWLEGFFGKKIFVSHWIKSGGKRDLEVFGRFRSNFDWSCWRT